MGQENRKRVYLITGITGFIGRKLAKDLLSGKQECYKDVRIIGLGRDKNKMLASFSDKEHSDISFIETDYSDYRQILRQIDGQVDYVIHCASPTASAYMISNPVETADCIVAGTRSVLALAKELYIKSMVFLSSMEAYGTVADIGRARTEEELGDISLTSVRSCYCLGKRMAEHYCSIFQQEYQVPVKVARLSQIFGTGVRPDDNRVYMQFARAAVEGRDIVLKTQGTSMGNYCSSDDAVRAILTILEKGRDGEIYNVVNEANTMRIRDMAQMVALQAAGGKIKVKIECEDIQKTGYAPDTGLRLSGEKLRKLGWQPVKGLMEMYQEIIQEISCPESGRYGT